MERVISDVVRAKWKKITFPFSSRGANIGKYLIACGGIVLAKRVSTIPRGSTWESFISHRAKKNSLIVLVGTLLSFSVWGTVFAAAGVSNYLSYQGRLTDTSGNPLGGAGTNYCFSFSVFDAPSGGNKLWPTTATTTTILNVVNGVFNASIGDVSTVNFSANDTQYLNVDVAAQVGGVCTGVAWETLLPRQKLDSVAYARAAHDLYGGDAQIGTAAGVASGQNLLKLDVKTVADTVGASGCSPNGAMWYNSGNARTLVCNNNLYQAVGSSIVNQFFDVTGPTTAVKTFTFPDASATVLTSAAAVTIGQGGTGTTTAIAAFNALSPLTTKGDVISNDGTNDVRLAVGTNGQFLTASSTAAAGIAWATISGGSNALLDGSSHTDTTAGTVARGDIITGQTATPKWTRLAKGTANQVLSMDGTGTDVVWATPTGGGTPGGADTQLQFNNGGAFAGDPDFTWASSTNDLTLGGVDTGITIAGITNEPAAPAAGSLHYYSKKISGRMIPKVKGPSGLDTPLQSALWGNNITLWTPTTATAGVWQGTAGAGAGTYTTALPTTTSLYTAIKRGRWANVVTTTNQVLGQRNTEAMYFRGAAVEQGGFFFFARAGFDVWTNGGRFFAGFHTATTVVSGDPSALNNTMGFAVDAADNGAISFLTRGTVATKAATGFTITSGKGYDLYMFAPSNDTNIYWRIVDINTGTEASGTATANLPTNTTMETVGVLASNAALTPVTSIQLGINRIYVETDY